MAAGYSGTPLAKKLGFRPGMKVWAQGMPASVRAEIEEGMEAPPIWLDASAPMDAAHLFVTERAAMKAGIATALTFLSRDGMIWVSWPKKASGVASELAENDIRAYAIGETDLVDIKVCAVDATWSGLKLVIRKERR